jgi:prepilin-type N-terminal cleavage/methylation domain-containing protein
MSGRNKDRGFTLIELLVVLALVSIFITFASVSWVNMGKSGKEHFLEAFTQNVLRLREDAIENYETRYIEFDIAGNNILTGKKDGTHTFVETGEIEVPEGYHVKDVVINGQVFALGKRLMTFQPSGMTDRLVLHLEAGDLYYSLRVNPLTARVTGENGYTEETTVGRRNNPA